MALGMFYFICGLILMLCIIHSQQWCWYTRCCLEPSTIIPALLANISSSMYGQHIATEVVLTALKAHLTFSPKKALVLSFHGPSGVGKTFLAKKIGHHLFNGETYYVKFYSGRNNFVVNEDIVFHKASLSNDLKTTVEKCPHAIFIFDEAEKMSDGLFDVLRPYTDFYDQYQGVDYRRAIFIFLTNIGSSELSKLYFNRKVTREEVRIRDFESVLSKWLFNKPGGFKESTLIANFLVDYYVPFLPLEKEHILNCIHEALADFGYKQSNTVASLIYDELPRMKLDNVEYIPSNCKKVHTLASFYASRENLPQIHERFRDEI